MDHYRRYALYYARAGCFRGFRRGLAGLGLCNRTRGGSSPDFRTGRAAITATPRKYGFRGETALQLAEGKTAQALRDPAAKLAGELAQSPAGLSLRRIGSTWR